VVTGTLLHPIHESRRIIEPTYDRITRYIGTVITAPVSFVRWLVTLVVNFVTMVARTVLTFVLELPLRLLGLFGVRVDAAIDVLRKTIASIFGVVTGAIEGALRAPEAMLGSAFNFLRDLASLRWIRQPELLLQTFLQPIFGAMTGVLTPVYYTLRGLDDALFPPRELNAQEREALLRDYPASLLSSVRLHDRGILHAMMWGEAGAQTIGNDIYLSHQEPGSPDCIHTLRHELVHTSQVNDLAGGTPAFVASYYSHMIANMLVVPRGTDLIEGAYSAIPYEVEAYALQAGLEHTEPLPGAKAP
jgi:hypothetical protein